MVSSKSLALVVIDQMHLLHAFHDGLLEGISEMKGLTSLDMIHSLSCFLEKHSLNYEIQWCV